MKKKVIFIVLFLFCGLIISGSIFHSKDDTEGTVRNVVLEDRKLDLSYYENKYDIYNAEKTCFEITESYQSNNKALGRNSNDTELEVKFYLYVNKEDYYFIFSYEAIVDEEVVLTSRVKIDFVEYENRYYLVSSNGCVTPYDEAIQEYAIGDCALCYAYFDESLGLGGLGERGLFGGGGGGGCAAAIGGAIGLAGAVALASSGGNNSGSLSVPHLSGSSAAGSIPPNGNKNNNNKKKSIKDIIDDIKDEYKQNGQCNKFADELEAGMKENGISGERVKATPKTGREYVYSDKFGYIGNNGFHEGIKIGDIIYDNLRPEGIPYQEWIADLGGEYWMNIFKVLI